MLNRAPEIIATVTNKMRAALETAGEPMIEIPTLMLRAVAEVCKMTGRAFEYSLEDPANWPVVMEDLS